MTKYVPDIVLLVGLILIGVGVGMYSVPLALTSVGCLMVLLAIFVTKNGAVDNVS